MGYRLALDIGTNSIGWWMYELDGNRPCCSVKGGVRIFSDGRNPKEKTTLASSRRAARMQRRQRDRFLARQRCLLNALMRYGFFPKDKEARKALIQLDPYELRAKAVDGTSVLKPEELGRIFFHLNQRRGFKSNRKTEAKDPDAGITKQGIKRLRLALEEEQVETLGALFFKRQAQVKSKNVSGPDVWVRARRRSQTRIDDSGKEKSNEIFELYPERSMIEDEFEKIWEEQAVHHPDLMRETVKKSLYKIIFSQRPLKPVDPGNCTLSPNEKRLPWADPLSQKRRIYEEVNHLRILTIGDSADKTERLLTRDERDLIVSVLLKNAKQTFTQLKKLLKIGTGQRFNLESDARKDLNGDQTAARLAKKNLFGTAWYAIPFEKQRIIVQQLLSQEDEESLVSWLIDNVDGLDPECAQEIAQSALPDGYASLGETASQALLKELEEEIIPYSEAARRAGYHHSNFNKEPQNYLPYYGEWIDNIGLQGTGHPEDDDAKRFGRIANPTVHIGLNQLRKLVNGIIKEFGRPQQVVIEMARELKLNEQRKKEINKTLKVNRDNAERHQKQLEKIGLPGNGENRLRFRLYDELGAMEKCCPYCGKQISQEMLFSSDIEIDHILPFSKTLDNSFANKVLSCSPCNRDKGCNSPYDAFHNQEERWMSIAMRAEKFPENKRWRFLPNAMERFTKKADFLDRHLVDTQYLSVVAKKYLSAVCEAKNIYAVPGTLTSLLRGKLKFSDLLGSSTKNRNDHRHHALDAAVIGLMDRYFLQQMAVLSAQSSNGVNEEQVKIPPLCKGLRDEITAQLEAMIVSVKPEHGETGSGIVGQFFSDTAYGIIGEEDKRGVPLIVHRIPISELNIKRMDQIRDPLLKLKLKEITKDICAKASLAKTPSEKKFLEKDFIEVIQDFIGEENGKDNSPFKGLRRVRITDRKRVTPIFDKKGKPYKGYASGGNYSYTIWQLPDGKWDFELISLYDAARGKMSGSIKDKHPTAKKIFSLRQNDLVAVEQNGQRKIMRVVKFDVNGRIDFAEHFEAGALVDRDKSKDDPFKYSIFTSTQKIKDAKMRKIRVTETGKLYDPGALDHSL